MSYRTKTFLSFVFCCFLISAALYFEIVKGLAPCPLCILQRLLIILLGVLFVFAFLHNPKNWGRKIYAALCLFLALGGIAASIRQIWLQLHPHTDTLCVPSLMYLLKTIPLTEVLKILVAGTSDCSTIQWQFLGLTMPSWTLICFAILAIATYWTAHSSTSNKMHHNLTH